METTCSFAPPAYDKTDFMKSYLITVPVKRAVGFQRFVVEATSEKDASKAWQKGKAKYVGKVLQIVEFGEPKIELNE